MPETWRVSELLSQLETPDPWRDSHPFSEDIESFNQKLFEPGVSRANQADLLAEWLSRDYQPCWFGRMEAKRRRLAFCILNENDLAQSDQHIRVVIERERTAWKARAASGASHGFLIALISEDLARARRGPVLQELAETICELYLGVRESDRIHHDDLLLKLEVEGVATNRRWRVGVNYFSAQGDGLWWRDHRIPGGMAFSMNSVGHMARVLADDAIAKDPTLAAKAAIVPREKLTYWAVPTAMGLIGAPVAGSGRGTWLADWGSFPEDKEPPTFDRRHARFRHLAKYSENRYKGRYHTDITIPSDYFEEELWELEEIGERDDLYFTYLHSLADEAYESMGIGIEEANFLQQDGPADGSEQ